MMQIVCHTFLAALLVLEVAAAAAGTYRFLQLSTPQPLGDFENSVYLRSPDGRYVDEKWSLFEEGALVNLFHKPDKGSRFFMRLNDSRLDLFRARFFENADPNSPVYHDGILRLEQRGDFLTTIGYLTNSPFPAFEMDWVSKPDHHVIIRTRDRTRCLKSLLGSTLRFEKGDPCTIFTLEAGPCAGGKRVQLQTFKRTFPVKEGGKFRFIVADFLHNACLLQPQFEPLKTSCLPKELGQIVCGVDSNGAGASKKVFANLGALGRNIWVDVDDLPESIPRDLPFDWV